MKPYRQLFEFNYQENNEEIKYEFDVPQGVRDRKYIDFSVAKYDESTLIFTGGLQMKKNFMFKFSLKEQNQERSSLEGPND